MRIHRCGYGQPWESDSVIRSNAIDSLSLSGIQTEGNGFDFWNLNFIYCPYKGSFILMLLMISTLTEIFLLSVFL